MSRFAGIAALEMYDADCLRVEAPAAISPSEDPSTAWLPESKQPRGKLYAVEQAAFEFAAEHPEGSYRTTIARVLIGSQSKTVTHLRNHRLYGQFSFLSRQVVMFILDNMIDTGRLRVLEEPAGDDMSDW